MTLDEFIAWTRTAQWWEAVSFRDTAPHEWARPENYAIYRAVDRCIRTHSDSRTLFRYKGLIVLKHQYWTTWPVVNRALWCALHHTATHVCEPHHE